jgi:hypothetical protein
MLTFADRGYFTVQTAVDSVLETILFPARGTILDFISMIQDRIWVRSSDSDAMGTMADPFRPSISDGIRSL